MMRAKMHFFNLQVLVIGDSLIRNLPRSDFDVRSFPGYTAKKILDQVMMNLFSLYFSLLRV